MTTTILLSAFMDLTTLDTSCRWNHTIFVLLCLVYFTLLSSSFIHVVACARISFIRLNNIPLHVYTTFCLSIHPSFGHLRHLVASTTWLLWIMLLWTDVYKYLFESLLSIPLDIYPEVELLDHMVVLFSIFWGTSIMFSIVAALIYILANGAQVLPFLHILRNTSYFLSFGWQPF